MNTLSRVGGLGGWPISLEIRENPFGRRGPQITAITSLLHYHGKRERVKYFSCPPLFTPLMAASREVTIIIRTLRERAAAAAAAAAEKPDIVRRSSSAINFRESDPINPRARALVCLCACASVCVCSLVSNLTIPKDDSSIC